MGWLERRKERKAAESRAAAAQQPSAAEVADDRAVREAEAAERITRLTSIRARVGSWFKDLGWVTFLFFVIALLIYPSGWWIVLGLFLFFGVVTYAYTNWVHKPPVVPVALYADDGTGGVLGAWLIPVEIWDQVAKTGLSNTISTQFGTTYLVRDIKFADDERRLPVAIEFAWIHINELNFATKRELFPQMQKLIQILIEENNRYKWLMEVITLRKAVALVKRWIRLMSNGRFAPLSAQDEVNLEGEIAKLAKERAKLDMPGLTGDEEQEFSAEGEPAPTG